MLTLDIISEEVGRESKSKIICKNVVEVVGAVVVVVVVVTVVVM